MKLRLRINKNILAISLLSSWYLIPYVSTKLGAIGFVALFVLWISTTNLQILYSSINSILFFLIWYIFVLLTMATGLYSGTSNILYYLLMSFAFAVPIVIWNYYSLCDDERYFDILPKIVIICSLFCSVMTVAVLSLYPEAAKKLAMGDFYITDIQFYYELGCGGFGNIYGYVIMFVPLMLYRPKSRKWVFIKGMALVLGILAVVMSLYTIALLLILISLSILVIIRVYKRNTILAIILTLVIIFTLFFLGDLLGILAGLLTNIGFNDTALRVKELADAFVGQTLGYNLDGRMQKYERSLQLFLTHPLLGNQIFGGGQYGGHSTVLDELAKYGFLMYLLRIVFINKSFEIQKKKSSYALLVSYFIYILLALLNPTIYIYQVGYCLLFASGVLLRKEQDESIVY